MTKRKKTKQPKGQLPLFPPAPFKSQSIADVEAEAVRAAEKAEQLFKDGFEHQAATTAYHAMILFEAVREIRRRRGKDSLSRLAISLETRA